MVVVEELHGAAATDDLLDKAGGLQSFFDQLGLEVAAAGGGEGAEEELEWLSNKDSFPTLDTMEPEPALVGPRTKVVRRRRRRLRRRSDEEVDCLPNKDAFLEGEMVQPDPSVSKMVRRRQRADGGLDGLPNKGAFPVEGMVVDPEPAVTKVIRRQRRLSDEGLDGLPNKGAFPVVGMVVDPEPAVTMVVRRRRRRADEEVECLPNKNALLKVDSMEREPALMGPRTKVVRRQRRRLRRRADEGLDWLPIKDAFLEVERAEPEPALTRMVLRRRRAGPPIAPMAAAAKPGQRRCSQCGRRKTPHWRTGPEGPRTLCNACGKRYRSERLVPEHRPLSSSATFRQAPELHPSMPRRIVEMCRSSSSATLVDVVVRLASPTNYVPPRTKEAFCKKSRKPFRTASSDDLLASSDPSGLLEVAAGGGGEEVEVELEWPSNEDALPVLETMEREPRVKDVPAMETTEPKPSLLVRPRRRAVATAAAELGQGRCRQCGTTETPQWREGPEGRHTLCNACGLRYRSGGLVPEYRPLSSPTFSPELHSNIHRRVVKMHAAGDRRHPPPHK